MGSLFIVAEVLGRYRQLAAVHHLGLSGGRAVLQCHLTRQIHIANAALLRRDLAKAKELFADENTEPKADAKDKKARPSIARFPGVLTCLMIGASATPDESRDPFIAQIHLLPVDITLNEIDNRDDITVFDITDPKEPRYCFVCLTTSWFVDSQMAQFYSGDDSDEEGELERIEAMAPPENSPLTASQYMLMYEDQDPDEDVTPQVAELDALPLVSVDALSGTWPESQFRSDVTDKDATEGAAGEDEGNHTKTLREKSMSAVLSNAFENDPSDLSWLSEAEALPDFSRALWKKICDEPQLVGKPSWATLMKSLTDGSQQIDLSPFEGLTKASLFDIIAGAGKYCSLRLPSMPDLTIEDIGKLIALGKIADLHFGPTQNFSLDQCLRAISGHHLRLVTHPEMYQDSIKRIEDCVEKQVFPFFRIADGEARLPSGVQSGFPLVQIVFTTHMTYGQLGEHTAHPKYKPTDVSELWRGREKTMIPLPMTDMLLSVEGILDRVPGIITGLAKTSHLSHDFGAWQVECTAMASSIKSDCSILPIPPDMYTSVHSQAKSSAGLPPPARPLKPGEWTLFAYHKAREREDYVQDQADIRYSFATIDEDGRLRAMSAEAFVQEMKALCPTLQLVDDDVSRFERNMAVGHPAWFGRMEHDPDCVKRFSVAASSLDEVEDAVDLMQYFNEGVRRFSKDSFFQRDLPVREC